MLYLFYKCDSETFWSKILFNIPLKERRGSEMKYTGQLIPKCRQHKNGDEKNLKYPNPSQSNGVFVNYSGVEPSVLHLYALILAVYNGENRHIRNY